MTMGFEGQIHAIPDKVPCISLFYRFLEFGFAPREGK